MIRCLICGFNNLPTARKCEKCHSSLNDNSATGVHRNDSLMPVNNETKLDVSDNDGIEKTIVDISATGDVQLRKTLSDNSNYDLNSGETDNSKCSKCSYPLRPNEVVCPNCGTEQKKGAENKARDNSDDSTLVMNKLNLAKTASIDTIDFAQTKTPKFKLSIFKGKKSTVFEGLSVVLNRTNTDLNNSNISKEAHAVVEFKDNKWILKDVSSNGATFVQVTQPTEVKDKDLIIIGNVIYRFEVLKGDE